jgi:hypothetical protein
VPVAVHRTRLREGSIAEHYLAQACLQVECLAMSLWVNSVGSRVLAVCPFLRRWNATVVQIAP